jgi:hypothetical protein
LARTAAFTVLAQTQLFKCFNARSASASAFGAPFSNRWLWAMVALSAALQAAVVYRLHHPRIRYRAALDGPVGGVRGDGDGDGERCALVHRRAQAVATTLGLASVGGAQDVTAWPCCLPPACVIEFGRFH